ncbi:MAG: 7-cyano-7-deazaguanine synthase QueC [Akkermansia sp.]
MPAVPSPSRSRSQDVAVLLSGGLDSSVALHWAASTHHVVLALSFDYGSKHASHELACATQQAQALGIEHHIIDIKHLSQFLKSSLLEGGDNIPDGSYEQGNMSQTVVPFRNGIFLAIAAGIAESHGAQGIVIAAHSGDHDIYPDCREEFMTAMAQAIQQGTYAQLGILRPFIHLSKGEIVKLGHQLHVDFAHTYSCYKGGQIHCGTCATCIERKEAFIQAGILDPTIYAH